MSQVHDLISSNTHSHTDTREITTAIKRLFLATANVSFRLFASHPSLHTHARKRWSSSCRGDSFAISGVSHQRNYAGGTLCLSGGRAFPASSTRHNDSEVPHSAWVTVHCVLVSAVPPCQCASVRAAMHPWMGVCGFPLFCLQEQSCRGHSHLLCRRVGLVSLVEGCGPMAGVALACEETAQLFSNWLHHFPFPSIKWESPGRSMSLPTFGMLSL